MINIIGISSFFHDSAVALIRDGKIISAVQEERFTRIKHDAAFPKNALIYILREAKLNLDEIDKVIFFEKPFLKFERLVETYVSNAPFGFKSFSKAMPIWLREKLFQKKIISDELKKISKNFNEKKLLFSEHHLSHAASAFYPSPFEEAVVLTIDGVGEWATTTISIGKKNKLEIIKEINYPHSLGLLYSAFTYYLGFKVNSGEYKVMGLAPYGNPKFEDVIFEKIVDLKSDGSFRINQSYFNYSTGLTMTNNKFSKLFGKPFRKSESEKLEQFHMDIAASIQSVIEKIIIKMTKNISKDISIENLCIAGGVGLNCVANGKILEEGIFKNIWIQPAAGDAGGAIGAALLYWYSDLKKNRVIDLSNPKDQMNGSYLGPEFDDKYIEVELKEKNAIYKKLSEIEIIEVTAKLLAEKKTIGWFQGRMEFGPRALGSRSIIADPRSNTMQKNLNLKVKYRESFRPFAPAILKENLSEWFDLKVDSPYMLLVTKVKKEICNKMTYIEKKLFGIDKLNIKRSSIPAVTHVDYSARIQTVDKKTNPKFHALISQFKKITNCPILINTSFNVRGEPIVCSPTDAFRCFMSTELDALVMGNFILIKSNQIVKKTDYIKGYTLD